MVSYLYRRMNRTFKKIKYRAVGSGVLIVISVMIYIGLMGMLPVTEKAITDMVNELELHDHLVTVNSADEGLVDELSTIPGVKDVESRILVSSRVDSPDWENDRAALLYGVDPLKPPEINKLKLATDDSEYFDDNGSGILIERNFAINAGIDVGDEISVNTLAGPVQLTVAALVRTPENVMLASNPKSLMPMPGNLAVVFVSADWLRDSFGFQDGYVNQFLFTFNESVNAKELQNTIDEQLSPNVVVFTVPREKTEYASIMDNFEQSVSMVGLFALIFLSVAFFIVYTSFARIVHEQRKEIGVLRALGHKRTSVMGSYIYMALIIGTVSSLMGVIFGIWLGQQLGVLYVDTLLALRAGSIVVPMDSVVAGFLFGPITAILACLVAVWGTVSMPPYDAIRGTPRTFLKNRIWRRSPKVGKAPRGYITHYTFRNMSRHKVRTALTVVAIGGAIMLGSYSLFVLSSFYNSVSDGMEEYEKWDVLVEFAYPINGTLAAQVDSSDITEKAYVARIVGEWQMGTKQGSAVIIGMEAGQTLHRFKIHEGKAAQEPSEAMLNAQAAGEEGIRIGDTIELQGISGTVQLDVTALVDDYIGTLFVDMNVIEDIVGERIYSGMYLKTTPGKAEDVMTELQASPLVAEAMTLRDTVSGILGYFESYGAALYILTLLGVAVAAPTLVNIVFVGVLERYPEYGQLRAIGYPRKAVSKTILTELVVIVTAGAIIGIPLTYLMVLGFEGPMKSYIPVYSTLLYPADWLQFLAVLGLIYVIAFLAAAPSIRHVNRMDLAETIGERGFG